MRVIAGSRKGKKLKCLPGLQIRPTSDRLKEAFFSKIAPLIEGCSFLDCFAGCGGIGIEAMSRGAAEVVFVEANKATIKVIKENLQLCDFTENVRILSVDWKKALQILGKEGCRFNILFFDPPYHEFPYEKIFNHLASRKLLYSESLIALEHYRHIKIEPEEQLFFYQSTLRAGDSCISLFPPLKLAIPE